MNRTTRLALVGLRTLACLYGGMVGAEIARCVRLEQAHRRAQKAAGATRTASVGVRTSAGLNGAQGRGAA